MMSIARVWDVLICLIYCGITTNLITAKEKEMVVVHIILGILYSVGEIICRIMHFRVKLGITQEKDPLTLILLEGGSISMD